MDFQTLTAQALMTSKIVYAEPFETLRVAIGRMCQHNIHCLLVAAENPARGISILTGKDCIRVLANSGVEALDDLCVEDAMTRPAVTVPASLCIEDCIRLMQLSGVRTTPVLEDGELVGILSFTDVLKTIAAGKD